MEAIEKTFTFICILFAISLSFLTVYTILTIACNIWADHNPVDPEDDEND